MPEVHASEVVLEGVNEGELDVEFVLLITAIIDKKEIIRRKNIRSKNKKRKNETIRRSKLSLFKKKLR